MTEHGRRWEWKVTTEWIPGDDYYYMRIWEREVDAQNPEPWRCIGTGGARGKEQFGEHRRLFAKIIRSVIR